MSRLVLHHERAGRYGQVRRHSHDLHLVSQLPADQLDPLGGGERLLVADIEGPATSVRVVHGQQDSVRRVLAERPGLGGQAPLGEDDGRAAV